MTTRTQVSRANPAIKAILAATFPGFTGRKVTVIEADPSWEYRMYSDDRSAAASYDLGDGSAVLQPRAPFPGTTYFKTMAGIALVFLVRHYSAAPDSIEIVIDAEQVDRAAIEVAVDAMLAKKRNAEIAATVGPFAGAGIALALAEVRAKDLARRQAASDAIHEALERNDTGAVFDAVKRLGRARYREIYDRIRSGQSAEQAVAEVA